MLEDTRKMAEAALREMLGAIEPLLSRFQMKVTKAETEGAFADVCVKNLATFVRIVWHPRDKYMYSVGPLCEGEIPPVEVYYVPGQSRSAYGMDQLVRLAPDSQSTEMKKLAGLARSSPGAGIQALLASAESLLQGDWTRRSELDAFAKENYEDAMRTVRDWRSGA